jgi:hypothetical protein
MDRRAPHHEGEYSALSYSCQFVIGVPSRRGRRVGRGGAGGAERKATHPDEGGCRDRRHSGTAEFGSLSRPHFGTGNSSQRRNRGRLDRSRETCGTCTDELRPPVTVGGAARRAAGCVEVMSSASSCRCAAGSACSWRSPSMLGCRGRSSLLSPAVVCCGETERLTEISGADGRAVDPEHRRADRGRGGSRRGLREPPRGAAVTRGGQAAWSAVSKRSARRDQPSVLRGLSLTSAATWASSSMVWMLRSVPLGK